MSEDILMYNNTSLKKVEENDVVVNSKRVKYVVGTVTPLSSETGSIFVMKLNDMIHKPPLHVEAKYSKASDFDYIGRLNKDVFLNKKEQLLMFVEAII